ncbi:MAG: MATE family efflux transporter [Oscillospiraceae bacterium]|nr:MATE family efflux transporter [Oscillospiraceae bacterium]
MHRYIGDRSFYKRVFTILLPILVQNVITTFVSLLDNIMVGQVGTEPMSGVAIVNQLFFVYNLFALGGISGAGILTAQFYGKGDQDGIRQSVRVKLWIAVGIFAAFYALLVLFGDRMILLFLHEGDSGLDLLATERYAREYLDVMLIQLLPFAITMVYSSTLRETGETLLPMKAGLIAVFVNLIFNYILIFGKLGAPALGVVGAAMATVLSRFVELAVVVLWTHRHPEKNPYIVGLYQSLYVPRDILRQMLILGLPLMINELLWSGGMTFLNQCYSIRGLEVVSAFNIYSTISNLFFSAFISTGNATAIMVGQLLGAGELDRAVEEDRRLLAFAVALSILVGALQALTAPLIPRIYNTISQVRQLATDVLLISALMLPLHAFANSCYFTLRSGGKTGITFIFDSGILWAVNIPAAFILAHFTSVPIIPMFVIVEGLNLIKCIVGIVMVHKKSWVVNLVGS